MCAFGAGGDGIVNHDGSPVRYGTKVIEVGDENCKTPREENAYPTQRLGGPLFAVASTLEVEVDGSCQPLSPRQLVSATVPNHGSHKKHGVSNI